MKHFFELYTQDDVLSAERWNKLHLAITSYIGLFGRYELVVSVENNVMRYFVTSDKDLGVLSNNIEIGVLQPADEQSVKLPAKALAERLMHFVTGGNLLDLKEKMAVKRAKQLEFAVFSVRRLTPDKAAVKARFYFQSSSKQWSVAHKTFLFFPANLLSVDFTSNTRYLRKSPPKYLNIEKALHLFSPANVDALLSINGFPYSPSDYYLPLPAYEFDKHSFIIGASGSGKSKFIELFIDRLQKTSLRLNYHVVVIDPHANLAMNLKRLKDSKVIDFSGETTELFSGAEADISAATELTTMLMKSLLAEQFNARLERVLRFSLFVLFVGQTMSLGFLKRFLTELELRTQLLEHVGSHIPPNIQQFFATDFNEIRTTHYNDAILPIVSLVDEMQLQPSLVGEGELSLAKTIGDNFLTVFSLNKVSMGEKVVKTVAGLLIQQIFLLAQARVFGKRVLLFIDEVSIVQNPALASILSEARKFNLTVVLTQQYFGQVEKDLRDAIFANVLNYYVFKVSEEDAGSLVGNLNIELPKEVVEKEHAKGIKEETIKLQMLTELHPRECLVRVMANGQVVPCFRARTLDVGDIQPESVQAANLEKAEPVKQADLPSKFKEGTPGATKANLPSVPSASNSLPPEFELAEPKTKLPESTERNYELEPAAPAPPTLSATVSESANAINLEEGQLAYHGIEQQARERVSMSLSELLASQSSSRKLVNKRKRRVRA